jgi:hypothetical protein
MMVHAPISVGELVDKITILELKLHHATVQEQRNNVQHELMSLLKILHNHDLVDSVRQLRVELKDINQQLWDIENAKRDHEKRNLFDDGFIQLARNVYLKNDLRAKVKRQINILCQSVIIEEKLY